MVKGILTAENYSDYFGASKMSNNGLYAVSALDGRYSDQLDGLGAIVGEGALIRYRVIVEAAWLVHLSSLKPAMLDLSADVRSFLEALALGKLPTDACAGVKAFERTTNHDVKAVEYWLRDALIELKAGPMVLSHIHFACTSEDINNLAYGLMIRDLRDKVIVPAFDRHINLISSLARGLKDTAMLSRTHGQTASPTTMGKELAVFAFRLNRQKKAICGQEILGKFSGAVGNFNAHTAAYPNFDWPEISREFVSTRLGLTWNPLTTQIESHDSFVEFMSIVRHYNTILIDFVRDMWGYISLGYFSQKTVKGEVGSSTMPHKVNPIFFENAEGNLGVASSLMSHFSDKLPISRWQRDLSDSTVLRVTGTAIGHSLLAWKSVVRGLDRVAANPVKMRDDLNAAWEVLAEPVQTVMRRYGVVDAYERLKSATRGEAVVTKDMIHKAIDQCHEIPESEKARMKAWTPEGYVGLAGLLTETFLPEPTK
jgi:adenylosuccinate lyase